MQPLVLVFYLFINILSLVLLSRRDRVAPATIFLATQLLCFVGIYIHGDFSRIEDRTLMYLYLFALVFYVSGYETFRLLSSYSRAAPTASATPSLVLSTSRPYKFQVERIAFIISISFIIITYFFAVKGTNVFLIILKTMPSGAIPETIEERLRNNYIIGSGYVYQLRVCVLPALISYSAIHFQGIAKKISIALFPFMLMFLLATGQRGGFAVFFVFWTLALLWSGKYGYLTRRKARAIALLSLLVFIVLFSVLTIANGRDQSSGSLFAAFNDRLFKDNQASAIFAFRHIYNEPIQWGNDWFMSLGDILPGKNEYVPIASIMFKQRYGSMRGTSPEDVWGSAYYNWGHLGVILFSFLLGAASRWLYQRFFKYPITQLRIFMYSFAFIITGTWIASGPIYLFNSGLVTLGILGFLLHIDRAAECSFSACETSNTEHYGGILITDHSYSKARKYSRNSGFRSALVN